MSPRARSPRASALIALAIAIATALLAPNVAGAGQVTLPNGKIAWNTYFGPYPNVPSIAVPMNPIAGSANSVNVPGGVLTINGPVAFNTPFRVQFSPAASEFWRAYDPADQNPATNGNYQSIPPARLTPPRLGVYAPTGYSYVGPQLVKVSCVSDYDCTYLVRDTENRTDQWWFTVNAGDYLVRPRTGTTDPPSLTVANGDTAAAVDLVVNPGPPLPTASFTYVGTGNPNEFSFLASSSSDNNVAIVRYDWDFGDGQTLANGPSNPTHTYTSPANSRVVTLTATFSNALTSVVQVTLTPVLKIATVVVDPTPTPAGGPFVLKVTLRNDGPSSLSAATPTVALGPASVASTTGAPTPASASLAPGQSAVFTVAASATAAGGRAAADVTATATRSNGATVTASAVHRTFVIGGGVTATVAGPDSPAVVGHDFPVVVTVANGSGSPVQLTSGALVVAPSSGVTVGGAVPASAASVADGQTATFTYTLKATTPATLQLDTDLAVRDLETQETSSVHATGSVDVSSDTIIVNTAGDEPLTDRAKTDDRCNTDADPTQHVCSLRAALQLANSRAGVNSSKTYAISFDIPVAGAIPTIAPATALPTVNAIVSLDGSTQSGGWVELSGLSTPREPDPDDNNAIKAVTDGLRIAGNASTVRGMVVSGWRSGINIVGSGVSVLGNRIGTDETGTAASPNVTGIMVAGPSAHVGGTGGVSTDSCTGDCNLISGNGDGVQILGSGSSTAVVANTIGTDVVGRARLANRRGVVAGAGFGDPLPTGLVIGGDTTLAGTGAGNLISGNSQAQVSAVVPIDGGPSVVGDIRGNLIGLDRTGSVAMNPLGPSIGVTGRWTVVSNVISGFGDPALFSHPELERLDLIDESVVGIAVRYATELRSNLIGTDRTGTRKVANFVAVDSGRLIKDNVISGSYVGIVSVHSTIQGNRIGTDITGRRALGNAIGVYDASEDLRPVGVSTIGGIRAGGSSACVDPCNVISVNTEYGVWGAYAIVQGNVIGLDIDGLNAVPNKIGAVVGARSADAAIVLGGASSAVASGRCDLACNLISGNTEAGASISSEVGAKVQGNVIGEGFDGRAVPNGGPGVSVFTYVDNEANRSASVALIGGDADKGNRIVANVGPAVLVKEFDPPSLSHGNVELRGNAMGGNSGGLVFEASVVPGPFRAPRDLTAARGIGLSVRVTGTMGFSPGLINGDRVDVYASPACESPTEGLLPVGSVTPSGLTGDFALTVSVPLTYTAITATATRDGSTSVFTECAASEAPTTTVSADAPAGTTELQVESNVGFAPGNYAQIGTGPDAPVRHIASIGSLIFDAPLTAAVTAGTVVTKVDPPGGDTTAPTVTVGVPTVGASVVRGSTVATQVSCADGTGVGVEVCRYPVTLDTATAGAKAFVVTAWDRNGNVANRTVSYTVTEPQPPVTALSVTAFRLAPARWWLPPVVNVSGQLTMPTGSSSACRDVTVSISATSMQQTVRSGSLRRVAGVCIYLSPWRGFVRTLVVDSRSGRWSLSGVAAKKDLQTIGSSTTIRCKIGVTDAAVTVPLVRDRFGVVSLRR